MVKRRIYVFASQLRQKRFYYLSLIVLFANIYLLCRLLWKEESFQDSKGWHPKALRDTYGYLRSKTSQLIQDKTTKNPLLDLLKLSNVTYSKTCSQPKLSLQHDALSFAFYNMAPLRCSGSKFFSLQEGFLIPNKTSFADGKVKTCQVKAIMRNTDATSREVKLFTADSQTNHFVNSDFIYIRCDFTNGSLMIDSNRNPFVHDNIESDENIGSSDFLPEKWGVFSMEETKRTTQSSESLVQLRHLLSIPLQQKTRRGGMKNTTYKHVNTSVTKRFASFNSHSPSLTNISGSYSQPAKNLTRYRGSDHTGLTKENRVTIRNGTTAAGNYFNGNLSTTHSGTSNQQAQAVLLERRQASTASGMAASGMVADDAKMVPAVVLNELPEEYSVREEEENYSNRGDHDYFEMPNCGEEQFLVHVSPLTRVFERSKVAVRPKSSTGLNVLMFGIDSMSSLTFTRKLPLTLHYLENTLEAVVYKGYNIVGDGTTQAILPIFLGKLQQEIPDILESPLDDLEFLWKQYQNQGYATLFAEDEPHLGVFNLRLKGFDQMPTDHYMRYFWQSQRESQLNTYCSEKYCTGSTPNHQFLLGYLRDFFYKYRNISRFAVGFSGELSHDEINPSQYLDLDLREFLQSLKADGHLSNTVLIVFSDHGSRRGKVRRTLQGKIEERLPFLAVYFPPSFRTKHPGLYRNVQTNGHRLTSPFDVHRTLQHLLKLSQKTSKQRGVSLLHHIPANRTCSQAGIDTHWCTCVKEVPVPTSNKFAIDASEAVVAVINNLTRAYRHECVVLKLNKTHSSSLVVPNEKLLKFDKSDDSLYIPLFGNMTLDSAEMQVTVETDMCHGVFEATILLRLEPDQTQKPFVDGHGVGVRRLTYHVDEQNISRINTYGPQSACICQRNPHIMKFCCCRDFLKGKKLKPC